MWLCVHVQYNLPASFDVLPVMARMAVGLVQHRKNTAVALLSLQWHVPREFKQQAKGGLLCARGIAPLRNLYNWSAYACSEEARIKLQMRC